MVCANPDSPLKINVIKLKNITLSYVKSACANPPKNVSVFRFAIVSIQLGMVVEWNSRTSGLLLNPRPGSRPAGDGGSLLPEGYTSIFSSPDFISSTDLSMSDSISGVARLRAAL